MKKLMIICLTGIVLLCGCGADKETKNEKIEYVAPEANDMSVFLVQGELISYEDTGDGNCIIKLNVWNHGADDANEEIKYAEITTSMEEFAPLSRKDETWYDAREILPGDYVNCRTTEWKYELKDDTMYAYADIVAWYYADDYEEAVKNIIKEFE